MMLSAVPVFVSGADWPTYMHDNARSGVTEETLDLKKLERCWVYESAVPPQVAWDEGAPWDAFAKVSQVPMRDFDFAFYVTAVGDSVFFGSSVNDSVHCLDAATGEVKWYFTTDGPVRFPPSYYGGRLYFGSDDGYMYCISSADGSLIWRYCPSEKDSTLAGNNGSLISMWPIRTATAVMDRKVYFAASLVNWENSYLCSLDAKTGSDRGEGLFKNPGGITPMGPLLASASKIYVPQGRLFPMVFDRKSGKNLGTLGTRGDGGCYALITPDSTFVYGSGRDHKPGDELREFGGENNDRIASHPDARRMVVKGRTSYILTNTNVSAVDRKGGGLLWNKKTECTSVIIRAGNVLFTGGFRAVRAINCADGRELWSAKVHGRARGLAAANGRLYVSTDTGKIYMFGSGFDPLDLNEDRVVNNADMMEILFDMGKSTLPGRAESEKLLK